jgi:hypothetical protein
VQVDEVARHERVELLLELLGQLRLLDEALLAFVARHQAVLRES